MYPPHARRTRSASRASSGAIGLVGLLLLSSAAVAAPVPAARAVPAATAASDWAYAGNRSISTSGATPNGTYHLTASFGYVVTLNETTGAGGALALLAHRVMSASYTLDYCAPSCSAPTETATIAFRALEVLDGVANLTTAAQVTVDGSPVAAVGLVSSTTAISLAEFENDSVTVRGPLQTHVGSARLMLAINGSLGVALAPALGLFPLHPSAGESWSSSAGFNATGAWSSRDSYQRETLLGRNLSGGTTLRFDTTRNGTLALSGQDLGNLTLQDGSSAAALQLTLSGPFDFREGILLLPAAADVFGSAEVPNAPGGNGSLAEGSSTIDFGTASAEHFGLDASATSFAAAGQDPGGASGAAAALRPASQGSGPVVVQAEPEPVGSAADTGACLISGACSGAANAPGGALAFRPLLGVAIGAVAVVAIVGTVVVTRRPKVPPRTNAGLYPPVGPTVAPLRPPRGAASPLPPAEDRDPLDHLW